MFPPRMPRSTDDIGGRQISTTHLTCNPAIPSTTLLCSSSLPPLHRQPSTLPAGTCPPPMVITSTTLPRAATGPAAPFGSYTTCRPRRRGCGRCVDCDCSSAPWCPPLEEFDEWWPAGLASPTVYYHLRARQLQYQCNAAFSRGFAWRLDESCPSALLAKRGAPVLTLNVPTAFTNVGPDEKIEYVGQLLVSLRPGTLPAPSACHPAQHGQAAPATACPAAISPPAAASVAAVFGSPVAVAATPTSSSSTSSSSSTCNTSSSSGSLTFLQPAKRTRLGPTPTGRPPLPAAPAACAVQAQWERPCVQSAAAIPRPVQQPRHQPAAHPGSEDCIVIPLKPVAVAPAGAASTYRRVQLAHGKEPHGQYAAHQHAGWLAHLRGLASELVWRPAGTAVHAC